MLANVIEENVKVIYLLLIDNLLIRTLMLFIEEVIVCLWYAL